MLARVITSTLDRVRQEDFSRTAIAKGRAWKGVLRYHALKHVGLDLLDAVPSVFALTLSDLIIVEHLFGVPGVAAYLVGGAFHAVDVPVIAGIGVLFASLYWVVDVMTLVIRRQVDPRLREGEAS